MYKEEIKDYRGSIIISRRQIHLLDKFPGYIVLIEDKIRGLITYNICNEECEIVSLDSKGEEQGIGTKLIDLVIEKAKANSCKRVWLITSNDNLKQFVFIKNGVLT